MKSTFKVAASVAAAAFAVSQVASAATLDDVKARGELKCGVSTGVPGFSAPNNQGDWEGIDAAVCQAVAAAVLGDSKKVAYQPLTAKERFTALSSGEIDVLSRNTTHTRPSQPAPSRPPARSKDPHTCIHAHACDKSVRSETCCSKM